MKLNRFQLLVAFAAMLTPVFGHHSFEAEYDASKTTTISGVVTKLDWLNPHAFVTLEFKDQTTGKIRSFKVEMGPPYSLTRQGWKRDSVKIGDKVTIEGCALAKNGTDAAGSEQTTHMVLANGQKLNMR
jgi:hypothetical protein